MVIAAVVCLGFLIGNLVGLSATSALTIILPLLFALAGGSGIAFLHKLAPSERKLASAAVLGLSLSCLVGLYFGMTVSERQWLSPRERRGSSETKRVSVADRKYLRTVDFDSVTWIDVHYQDHRLSADQAYQQLYRLVTRSEAP
jgi:hypothetical protein